MIKKSLKHDREENLQFELYFRQYPNNIKTPLVNIEGKRIRSKYFALWYTEKDNLHEHFQIYVF